MKVRIQDFQSIQDVSLEVKGFTVIVGRSNIGKSAIVRAIEGALTNKEGEDFVRLGKRYAEVDIECPGLKLNWKKGSGYNDYEINGEVLESVGRGAPPHISSAGFREIEVNKSKISVQVASQFSPIFLIDPSKTSGSVAAELISDVGRLGEIQTALRECARDKRAHESTIRVREADLRATQEALVLYESIEEERAALDKVKALRAEIHTLERQIQSLESFAGEVAGTREVMDNLGGCRDIEVPAGMGSTRVKEIEDLGGILDSFGELNDTIQALQGVGAVSIPEADFDADVRQWHTFEQFYAHVQQAQDDAEKYGGLREIPLLGDLAGCYDLLDTCKEYGGMVEDYEYLNGEIPGIRGAISAAEESIEGIHKEIHEILEEAGACPLCGSAHNHSPSTPKGVIA